MSIKELKPSVTDERQIEIVYKIPFVLKSKVVCTTLKQRDFLKIIRQVKNVELQDHLRRFVEYIDSFSNYRTDVMNQELSRKKDRFNTRDVTIID